MTRRRVIGATASVAAASVAAVSFIRSAPAHSYAPRSISIYNVHTGEALKTVYWADGHYINEAVRDINWILRDHYTDEFRPMNSHVIDLLGRLRERLETGHDPFLVVSGYRTPATNHMLYLRGDGVAQHSYHIKGMAIDLRTERRSLDQLHAAAVSLRGGGVGYYPASDFVHVDCGPIRYWG
jgi:uncharacterized protein YcbK (DUF882 family)